MQAAIFARTYAARDLGALFARIAADGFKGVQFNLSCAGLDPLPDELPDDLGREIGRRAAEAGLALCALSGTYNMAHPDAEARRARHRGFRNVVAAAAAMGAPIITLCTGSRDPADMWRHHPENGSAAAWRDLRHELDFALDAVATTGIRLAIEPEPGNVVADADLARRLLDEVGSDRLGIVLDAANLLSPETLARQQEIVDRAVGLLGPDIVLCHAKDAAADGRVVAAGQGAVDLGAFVRRVRASGFDGFMVGHGFAEDEAPGVARHLAGLIEDGR